MMKINYKLASVLLALLIWAFATTMALAKTDRFALVVGNSEYKNVSRLENPKNDSGDIADELRTLGFDVTHVLDTSRERLSIELRKFRKKSAGSSQTIVYYAGHGIETENSNYLIPVDAELLNEYDVEFEAIPLDLVVNAASGGRELQLVILDACRDNPFARKMKLNSKTRSISRGLVAVEPRGNSIVAYAARGGTIALDGTSRNSPYASALLAALRTPGLEVGKMLRQIRDDVMFATQNAQEPFFYGSLSANDYYLNPPILTVSVDPQMSVATTAKTQKFITKEVERRLESAFWEAISESTLASDYVAYLQKYPAGIFSEHAQRQLSELAGNTEEDEKLAALEEQAIKKLSGKNLTRAIQGELFRLGCNPGTPDGIWGRNSEAALANFRTATNSSNKKPKDDLELYRSLLRSGDFLCESFCEPNMRLENGTCKKNVVKAVTVKRAASVKPVATTNCRVFNGKQICG
jgi:hypothetical protein